MEITAAPASAATAAAAAMAVRMGVRWRDISLLSVRVDGSTAI
jgi:hypothetical protein